jgi:hypothetical protein
MVLVSDVPSAGSFKFPAPAGLDLPIDVDEAAGTVTLRRAGLPDVPVGTQGGIATLHLDGPDGPGTLDAAGNLSFPDVPLDTIFFGLPLSVVLTLSTGLQSPVLNDIPYPSHGVRLDFTSGIVTIEGTAILQHAPIVDEPVISGVRVTCQLDPIPDRTKLPAAPALKGLVGSARAGSAEAGDVLTLTTRIVGSRPGLSLDGDSLFVRIAGSTGQDVVLLQVETASLTGKGKRRTARDTDGKTIRVLAGHKGADTTSAPYGGRLTLVTGRKSGLVTLRVGGLDLSGLSGNLMVTVTLGPMVAEHPVGVREAAKLRKFR